MNNLVVLPQTAAPNPEAIEVLRDFLAIAESGELRCITLAGVTKDGSVRTAFVPSEVSIFEVIGAIECLRYRFLVKNIEL